MTESLDPVGIDVDDTTTDDELARLAADPQATLNIDKLTLARLPSHVVAHLYSRVTDKPFIVPQLESAGLIDVFAPHVSLPQLKTGGVVAPEATTIELPELVHATRLYNGYATTINLPALEDAQSMVFEAATSVCAGKLKTLKGDLFLSQVTEVSFPELTEARNVTVPNATIIHLPKLRNTEEFLNKCAQDVNLPALAVAHTVKCEAATHFHADMLTTLATDLILPKAIKVSLLALRGLGGHLRLPQCTDLQAPKIRSFNTYDVSSLPPLLPMKAILERIAKQNETAATGEGSRSKEARRRTRREGRRGNPQGGSEPGEGEIRR